MDFRENNQAQGSEGFNEDKDIREYPVTVHRTPEFEEEDGEEAFGLYAGDHMLAVCWNQELANAFKDCVQNVQIRVTGNK